MFHFLDKTCFGISGTLDKYLELFRQYDEMAWNDTIIHRMFVERSIYHDTIRETGDTWIRLLGGKYAYIALSSGGYPQEVHDIWVNGRYICENEYLIPGETWEDHPNADILLENVTYTNVNGEIYTGTVIYPYYVEYDSWIAYNAYEAYGIPQEDMPDVLVLTREEAEQLDLDRNTYRWPKNGLVYDGIEYPGTPFVHIPVVSISLQPTCEIYEGESEILEFKMFPENASDQLVYWSSADPTIVKVSSNGEITGISKGVAVVTVKTRDGALCANCTVTVFSDACRDGHSYEAVVTAPTCTEQGYTTYTCSICGETYADDYVDAVGHYFENDCCTECGEILAVITTGWSGATQWVLTFSGEGNMKNYGIKYYL